MADVSKAHKLKLAYSRKRFKELQELKKKKDASQKLENADNIINQPTPVDSLTSSTHSSINNEVSVENITGDTVTTASLPNYFDNTNYGDNSMFFDNLSKGEVSELNKQTSTSNIFNYFNTPHPLSSFESMVSNIVDTPKHTEGSFESKFSESYALFPQESEHNYVAETQQILHPDQDGLSLDDPEIKQNELFEHHKNSELFSSKNRQDLINYLQDGSKEKISESENSAIKNEIVCSSNTAQAEVKHSSAESLKQLSSQMAQLIEPEYAVSNPITDLEKRNLELATLLEQAQLNSEQQKGQLEELQARIANIEMETLQKAESNNIQTTREISQLKEELQSHIQTVGLLVAEKTELSAGLSQLELISKQKNSECEELQARLKASRSRAFELEQELNVLRAERTKKDNTGQEQSGIIEQLRQYSSSLEEQREELAQDLLEVREKLKNSSEDNFQLQKQNQELSRKLSLAEIRIQQITSGEQHQVDGTIEKLTQEKFELEKQLSTLALKMKTIAKEREESTSQFQQYTQELNTQLAGLSNQVQRLQQKNEDLSVQEQNRVKHIGNLERQLQSLQNEQVAFAVNRPSGELNLKNELDSTRELCIQLQLLVGTIMKPNYRFNQQNQQSYQPSPWAHQDMGYNNSASPWLDYQGAGYRQPYNRPMPARQRNDYMRRPMNKQQNVNKQQNKPNQNRRGQQKRKQNGSQAGGDKAAAKRKKEDEPQGIEVVIVPEEFPSTVMTDEQLDSIRTSLLQEIDNLEDEAFHPQFLDCLKRRGMLVISCNNQESVEWLKATIENLAPWEEAQLKVIEPKDLPVYYNIQIRIPGGTEEPDKLLERLERQNEGLLTKTWHLLNQKSDNKMQMILMSVEENVIEALKKIDFKPFLNFSRIEIRKLGVMRVGKGSVKVEEKKEEEDPKTETTEEEVQPAAEGEAAAEETEIKTEEEEAVTNQA